MKTIIICSERNINDHVGEYYDEVIEVPAQPTTVQIEPLAKKVKQAIRDLWKQDVEDEERDGEPKVVATLDAASPFNAMLIDYQIVLEKEENIKLELPYLESIVRHTSDREAIEILEKLEKRG